MSVVEMEELGFQQLEAEGFDIDEDLQPVYIPTSAPTDIHQVRGWTDYPIDACWNHFEQAVTK